MANRPIHEIRLGKVKAAIWRNETDSGVRYSVALVRIFRTDNGWESSPSLACALLVCTRLRSLRTCGPAAFPACKASSVSMA